MLIDRHKKNCIVVHLVELIGYWNEDRRNWNKKSKFLVEYPEDVGGKIWRTEWKQREKNTKN